MKVKIKIINAFSIQGSGGNPAGVVLDADAYSNEVKQRIAARAGFSETAFVSRSSLADFKLDFFTPVKQIPHCGHATIATFSYLKQEGVITNDYSSKETIDGTRQIRFVGEEAFMEQSAPQFFLPDESDSEKITASLSLQAGEVSQPFTIVNTGNSYALIEVNNEAVLAGLQPNFESISRLSEKYGLIGYYVYTRPENASFDATARMFAPFYGITEEAGTGMAAGPLACYLYSYGDLSKTSYRIEQGRFMAEPSPSLLKVNLTVSDSKITGLYAGGSAYVSRETEVNI